jgi:hypothetical protein
MCWIFFRRLRGIRVTPPELFTRAATAAGTGILGLAICSAFAHGTLSLPSSVTSHFKLGGGGGCGSSSGLGGGLMSRLGGSGGLTSGLSTIGFQAGGLITVFAGLAWILVVLGLGTLAARRIRFHRNIATSPLRLAAGPVLSASTTVLVSVALGLAVVVAVAGGLFSGNGGRAAGAALLAAPNVLFALLSTGAAGPWSLSYGGGQDANSPLSGLLGGGSGGGLLSRLGGSCGGATSTASSGLPSRSMSMAHLGGGGLVMHLALPLVVLLLLIPCGMLTAARTPWTVRRDGTPIDSSVRRAGLTALRLGVLWALVMFGAHLFFGLTLSGAVSLSSMPIFDLHANAGADSVLAGVLFAGVIAAAAGFLGSRIHDLYRRRTA